MPALSYDMNSRSTISNAAPHSDTSASCKNSPVSGMAN